MVQFSFLDRLNLLKNGLKRAGTYPQILDNKTQIFNSANQALGFKDKCLKDKLNFLN